MDRASTRRMVERPVWRRREVLALASVLTVAVVAYEVNRILNRTRKRGPSHFLEDGLSPPGETEQYLKGLEPREVDPLHTSYCDG